MAKIWLLRAAGGFSAERGSFPAERCCLFPTESLPFHPNAEKRPHPQAPPVGVIGRRDKENSMETSRVS